MERPRIGAAWTVLLGFAAGSLLGACGRRAPEAPKPRAQPRVEKYPWRLWNSRVEGPVVVAITAKRRLVGVLYDREPLGQEAKPVGLVGIDPADGSVLWKRRMPLKLARPGVPWSFRMSRNGRVLAVWLEGDRLMGIDIYTGRDFWEAPRPKSLGVARLGFGFVTVWGKKVSYLKPESGKQDKVFSLPKPASWPPVVTPEGQLYILAGKTWLELDVNTGKVLWSKDLDLPDLLPPARMVAAQDKVFVAYRTLDRVDTTSVALWDPKTLQPKWMAALPGRVRTHGAVLRTGSRLILLVEGPTGRQQWHLLDLSAGKNLATLPFRKLTGCTPGVRLVYCPYSEKGNHGIEALDARTLQRQWTWETVDDVSGRRHLWHKGIFYLAGEGKVLGLNEAGQSVFKAAVASPGVSLKVNAILGIAKQTLVVTAVDWTQNPPVGELWGLSLANGKRLWRRRLPAALYTTESVAFVGSRVFLLDGKTIRVLRAWNGKQTDVWPHRLPGPASKPPHVARAGDFLYAVRAGKLAAYRLQDGRPLWRVDLPDGARITGAAAGFVVGRLPGEAVGLWRVTSGKMLQVSWKDPADPIVAEAGGRLVLGGHDATLVLDPKTGKVVRRLSGVRHLVHLDSGALLAVAVTRRIPKMAGRLVMYGLTRRQGQVTVVELWHQDVPRSGPGLPAWVEPVGDYVFSYGRDGCLAVLGADSGKQVWRTCQWKGLAGPPRAYKGVYYLATGRAAGAQDGLLSLDPETGRTKLVFKLPGRTQEPDRFMILQYAPIRDGVVHLLTQGPRLRALKVAGSENP